MTNINVKSKLLLGLVKTFATLKQDKSMTILRGQLKK